MGATTGGTLPGMAEVDLPVLTALLAATETDTATLTEAVAVPVQSEDADACAHVRTGLACSSVPHDGLASSGAVSQHAC